MTSPAVIRSLYSKPFIRSLFLLFPNSTFFSRSLSNNEVPASTPSSSSPVEWRKIRLDQLERRFTLEPSIIVDHEGDLQPEWKAMESRVTKRRTLTADQLGGKTGRANIRQTEEDIWMKSGLYDSANEIAKDKK
jgi:hypothetical protein